MKILMVDDNNFSLHVTSNMLKEGNIGCDVILCNSGKKALEVLDNNEVDIMLLDIVMPEMTGTELLRHIRENEKFKDIQIIMLTSTTDNFSLKECFDLGANDFIRKPAEPIELIARVKAAIRVREYINEINDALEITLKQNKELNEITKKLKEAQFALIQREKMAAIGELAAGVAHEINNPMGFISSNFETLTQYMNKFKSLMDQYDNLLSMIDLDSVDCSRLTEEKAAILNMQKKYRLDFILSDLNDLIKDSKEGIDRVTKIVQSLRRFARTGLEGEMSYNDFGEIIEEALMITRNEAKYTTDIGKDFGEVPPVYCNRGQIGQVIVNIVVNAVQAIKSQQKNERGHINIKTYMEGGYGCIRISDDGPGIRPEIKERIFELFFTTKEVGEGTGLGLSICYDIVVNKHKGELTVESEIGKGTDFVIKLPVTQPE